MNDYDDEVTSTREWMAGPRFDGQRRLYSARQVVEQRGSIQADYPIARQAADDFYARLRELYADKRSITTFGPYSPGQAVSMRRAGIEGIYVGGWATSAKGSVTEDPGPDLASYPLSQVPDEAAVIVRALLTADKNQRFARSRMTPAQREASEEHDFRPFLIADADTGHGGDPHVRNLIRRFVEAGVPGYHIEDQRPGSKKCGHQGGKVLVGQDEQLKRLHAARFQLDVMGVAGIIVARTDAESATLLEGRSDERDQPFLLGATNVRMPSYKLCYLALLRAFFDAGVEDINGHLLYAVSDEEYAGAAGWLDKTGLMRAVTEVAEEFRGGSLTPEAALDRVASRLVSAWESEAGLKTYTDAVAEVMEFRTGEGETFEMTADEWREFSSRVSLRRSKQQAKKLGINIIWDLEHAKTPDGYYQIRGGIPFAIARSLAAAPFADVLWMETKTADLEDAAKFAHAIHAEFPEQMLAYNLSPSFNWDTTGMTEDEMRAFPAALGELGFVFNFVTYGGHQIDGLAGEEFALGIQQDGMLALARLQRKFRLLHSPYRTPQTLVGGPRGDAALVAVSGRTATTRAMGKGSTQFQHLVQTEVPPSLLEGWLALWSAHYGLEAGLKVKLRPHRAGSELLEIVVLSSGGERLANVIFATIQDRRSRKILSIRDQNTFDPAFRQKRLMTLIQVFLIHRYDAVVVHYVTPTEDNHHQTLKMKAQGIFSDVNEEVGQIIVAEVARACVAELIGSDTQALQVLIEKR